MKKIIGIALIALAGIIVVGSLVFVVRQGLAGRRLARELAAPVPAAPAPATTSGLEITPLFEAATADDGLIGGHGVSYLIRTDASTVLLDVGFDAEALETPPYLQNMASLGLSPDEVDAVVISHPHPDHVGSIADWRQSTVRLGATAGALATVPLYVPVEMAQAGAVRSDAPTLVRPDIATTGVLGYREVFPISIFDPLGAEQALVVDVAGRGLVLITGCGHPGLERLVTRAEALYDRQVVGVVGGLHYGDATAGELAAPIAFLASREPELVALSPHDSLAPALAAFEAAFPEASRAVRVGETIRFP